jgi:hypothetical protein
MSVNDNNKNDIFCASFFPTDFLESQSTFVFLHPFFSRIFLHLIPVFLLSEYLHLLASLFSTDFLHLPIFPLLEHLHLLAFSGFLWTSSSRTFKLRLHAHGAKAGSNNFKATYLSNNIRAVKNIRH